MKRNIALVASSLVALALLVPTTGLAAGNAVKPAIEIKTNLPGKKIIATPSKLGIYYWDTEKKAGGKIRCKGARLVRPRLARSREVPGSSSPSTACLPTPSKAIPPPSSNATTSAAGTRYAPDKGISL